MKGDEKRINEQTASLYAPSFKPLLIAAETTVVIIKQFIPIAIYKLQVNSISYPLDKS